MTIKPSDEQISGTMQTECWRGERQFEWDEISFAEEIVEDDKTLNFCVPICFDAAAVFGKPVEKLGPDDSFDVYANYDMDVGEVSEYLQILIKYWDGVEDTAMYHLTPEEREMFFRRMGAYCRQIEGKSLEVLRQEYLDEQSAAVIIEVPHM